MGAEGGGGVGLGREWMVARLAASEAGVPGVCVEAEACRIAPGLLLSIDGYSAMESKPSWLSWRDWGWRAAIAAASDVVAAGGVPYALAVSVGAREAGAVVEAARGVGEAASWMGATVASGDVNRCLCDAWIDVAVIGREVVWVRRDTARPGDVLVQLGYTGYGAVAALVLEGRVGFEDLPGELQLAIKRPGVPLAAPGIYLECGARAAIDNSDGFAYTVAQLALASGAAVELDYVLVDPRVREFLTGLGVDWERAALASWEDYNVLAAFPRGAEGCVERACSAEGLPCRVVGRFVEGARGAVYWRGERLEPRGWDSFGGGKP